MPSPSSADRHTRRLSSDSHPRRLSHPDSAFQTAHVKLPQEVIDMLTAVLPSMHEALGDNLMGVYLRGSLAMGDFDPVTSDLDFFAVTERPVSEAAFTVLVAMHARLDVLPNHYAGQLEGPYIDRCAARRFRPGERYPTIGRGEALAWHEHGYNWVLERWMVREHGITVLGPNPKTLIDPVASNELRTAARLRMRDWDAWANRPDDPEWLLPRNHKAYVVETMCRALYTLVCGELASKPRAVAWALDTLPEPWRSTVERSQTWHTDTETVDPSIVPEVMRFVHWSASHGEGDGDSCR